MRNDHLYERIYMGYRGGGGGIFDIRVYNGVYII